MERNEALSQPSLVNRLAEVAWRWGVVAVVVCTASQALAGSLFVDAEKRYALHWGLDPYYAFVGLNGSVISPDAGANVLDARAEETIYLYLLRTFFLPHMINVELSLNPMPIAGIYLKTRQRRFYDRAEIYGDVNMLESITVGFPEPGAVSLFLGNNAFLVNDTTRETEGIGFGGLLISYGNYHIANNVPIRDDWFEGEAKVKGIALSATQALAFSFRVGARLHGHRDIRNTVYLSMKRTHDDRAYLGWSILRNSDAEFRIDFAMKGLGPTRLVALVGKKVPILAGAAIVSLGVGVEGIFSSGYVGSLASTTVDTGWTLLLRPNVTF